ncbi:MAG TPA: hypothetical protein VFC72_06180 [Corynebacterium sp.]|nr:hypothetical protein [Corynebacterium sp.]
MDDRTWLAARLDHDLLAANLSAGQVRRALMEAEARQLHGAVLAPTHLALVPEGLTALAAVGYPTGRHHSLIKAAEARLAVEYGAAEIWLAVDEQGTDANARLADIVAVRQAVPAPVRLQVIATTADTRRAAATAGADGVVVDHTWAGGDEGLPVTVRGQFSAEQGIEVLAAGAARLALSDPAALLAELAD